jgi:biotin carboxylase
MRVLVLTQTTGYQTRTIAEAAERQGIEIAFATDRCDHLDDPWRDRAIPIRFHDEAGSVESIMSAAGSDGIAGLLALGDRPTVIAAEAARALGILWHSPDAARAARNKSLSRAKMAEAGLLTPWTLTVDVDADPALVANTLRWPLVVKPTVLSGSRGVMRADTPQAFVVAFERLKRLLDSHDVRSLRDPAARCVHIEGYIDGAEYALEGLLHDGVLHTLALFDKPDPLDGPFFEETIYVTPSRLSPERQDAIGRAVGAAVRALGLRHGPIHAECRVAHDGVYVLEVAARPIGGYCAHALSFVAPGHGAASLEELLLAHAARRVSTPWRRESQASGVMMIPIPRGGVYRGVRHADEAARVPHVTGVHISAKPDQRLVPLPEGASYLGFIFARAESPEAVEAALREAHANLEFEIDTRVPMLGT